VVVLVLRRSLALTGSNWIKFGSSWWKSSCQRSYVAEGYRNESGGGDNLGESETKKGGRVPSSSPPSSSPPPSAPWLCSTVPPLWQQAVECLREDESKGDSTTSSPSPSSEFRNQGRVSTQSDHKPHPNAEHSAPSTTSNLSIHLPIISEWKLMEAPSRINVDWK